MFHCSKRIILVLICAGILFGLCACRMEASYKEFMIADITGGSVADYLSSSDLEFARIQDIAIIPVIKEIQHGQYLIYISGYSGEKADSVTIKTATLSVDGETLLEQEINQLVHLEKNQAGIYEGYIEAGSFTDDVIPISHGQKMILSLQLQAGEQTKPVTKTIRYEITVQTYQSWVAPV